MTRLTTLILICLAIAGAVGLRSRADVALRVVADTPVMPRSSPPRFTPFADVETHRIRIVNAVDGAIQVSADEGRHWCLIGRVTAPATQSLMGYLAAGYARQGTVSATAVHGIRIRVGGLGAAYPGLINIVPQEFAHTPVLFGGHISGASGIYTNIHAGKSIFRELSPYSGNAVALEAGDGSLSPLPVDYEPREDDVLQILVRRPLNPLREVIFVNHGGGKVTATYQDGTSQVVTSVIQPVTGIGRFDGTSYTGAGAINTNHCGVITVSTAPISDSPLLEGDGPERRGGFQIEPAYHNSQNDEAGAPMILVVGAPDKKRQPDQEGKPPLFDGYFDLAWDPADPARSWRAQIQRVAGGPWLPMPALIGSKPDALKGTKAVRLIRADPGDTAWRDAKIVAAERAYESTRLAAAKNGKLLTERGAITLSAKADPRIRYVSFYVDGAFEGMTNAAPYQFLWDTTRLPDGEYVSEARGQDENGNVVTVNRIKFYVDNRHLVAQN